MGAERKIAVCLILFLLYAAGIWKERKALSESVNARQAISNEQGMGISNEQEMEKTPVSYSAGEEEKEPAFLLLPCGEEKKTECSNPPENARPENVETPSRKSEKNPSEKFGEEAVSAAPAHENEPSERKAGAIPYLTRKDDSLWKIARRHYHPENDGKVNEAVQEIARVNPWLEDLERLQPDKTLLLPVLPGNRCPVEGKDSSDGAAPIEEGSFPKGSPLKEGSPKAAPIEEGSSQKTSPARTSSLGEPTRHCVARGQTLRQIARQYYGDEGMWLFLHDANPGIDPQLIPCGAMLNIPRRKND